MARLPEMVPSAFLRVFQPIEAFDRAEQAHWERYLVAGSRSLAARPKYIDRPHSRNLGVISPADGEHAEIRIVEGHTFVSPWRMRLRVMTALVAFAEDEPLELSESYVPKRDAARVRRRLARLRRQEPSVVSFVHQSAWHVPIRWFVFFSGAERRLTEDEHGRLRLRYTTTVRRAMRRAEDAIPILRKAELGPITDLILDLHQWMAGFPKGSILELDYASLSELMSWDELDDDHSARDINEAIEALSGGEFIRSADIYQGVLGRWAEVRSREILN